MRAAEEHVGPLVQRVGEGAAGDQPRDVGRVVRDQRADLIRGLAHLADRLGEEHARAAEDHQARPLLEDHLPERVHVDAVVLVEGDGADAQRGGEDLHLAHQLRGAVPPVA